MRGADEQPGSMFSYVSLEERVPPDHPLRAIRRITDRALERLSPRFGSLYVTIRAPVDPARAVAAGAAAAGALHDPQRAAADGAAGLQPAVSLVRRAGDGRGGVGPHDVHEESGPAAGRRHRGGVLRRRRDPRGQPAVCSPTSTSPSMARCWKRGRARRASGHAIRTRRWAGAAIRPWTSTASAGPTRRTSRRPIRTRGSIRRRAVMKPGLATWDTCCWNTARA